MFVKKPHQYKKKRKKQDKVKNTLNTFWIHLYEMKNHWHWHLVALTTPNDKTPYAKIAKTKVDHMKGG
jgi:hypothetical protein